MRPLDRFHPDNVSTAPQVQLTYCECVGRKIEAPNNAGWESTAAGAHLRGRRTRDTQPEVALRRAVHALGLRFRLNVRVGRYRPDFVLPRHRLAVYVDGCFWHSCPEHEPGEMRGPNAARWAAKLEANTVRDVAANASLITAGWRVLRIWECETRRDVRASAARVLAEAHAEMGMTAGF